MSCLPRVSALLVVALVLAACTSSPAHDRSAEPGPLNLSFSKMALFNEDPCIKEGGQCLEETECPVGKLATRGLCPEQQKRGVECCSGVSVNVKDCRGRGGECTSSYCVPDLVEPAEDCSAKEVCCVRV